VLLTEYSIWFGFLCFALALIGSWLLYKNNPLGLDGPLAKYINWLLHVLRFGALFIVSFLLLGPLLKLLTTETQKPIIAIGIDNSQSLNIAHDSTQLNKQLLADVEAIKNELGNDYDVITYAVGKDLKPSNEFSFNEKESRLANFFKTVKNSYDGANLGAVVLATDGLYNNSENPLQTSIDLKAPVYTIALGDTVQRKDVLIKNTRTNQLVYKGNNFPLQVDVAAFAASAQSSTLTITQNGKLVHTEILTLTDSYFNTIHTTLSATESGTQHIVVEVSKITGEISTANNRMDVFVNVIDGRQKIALVALTPHPDLGAYTKAIEQNQNYSIETFIISQQQQPSKFEDYNLAIVHQLPGWNGEGLNLIKQFKQKNIPVLYVVGALTGTYYLLQTEPTVTISSGKGNLNEALPLYQTNFSLFTTTPEEQEHFKKLPPLIVPFGNYRITAEVDILMKQQIGYVKTDYPLIFFTKGENKSGFICGEGFWKWRLYDMALSTQQSTNNLIASMVQYLTSKKDQSRFRVNGKKQFDENESIVFDAELYNESYQLINTPEVSLVITNAKGKTFTYTFTKTNDAYTLNTGTLPTGNYSYVASTGIGSTQQQVKGQFIVKPTQLEFAQTTANHQLLNEVSTQTNGKLFYLNNAKQLAKEIKDNQQIKPIIFENKDVKSWMELKWIFATILTLLSIEWFIRKWNGSI
jgi:hypothetical protein